MTSPAYAKKAEPEPVTVDADAYPTSRENERKVFRNPRGTLYYYALVHNHSESVGGYDVDYWNIFYSDDGADWTISTRNVTTLSNVLADYWGQPSLTLWEDDANDRLVVYLCYLNLTEYPTVQAWAINDTDDEDDFYTLWTSEAGTGPEDDGIYNPNIAIAENGYIWLIWTEEWTNKLIQRQKFKVAVSSSTFPTSAPTWTVADWFGESGETDYKSGIPTIDGLKMGEGTLIPIEGEEAVSDMATLMYFNTEDDRFDPPIASQIYGILGSYDGVDLTEDIVNYPTEYRLLYLNTWDRALKISGVNHEQKIFFILDSFYGFNPEMSLLTGYYWNTSINYFWSYGGIKDGFLTGGRLDFNSLSLAINYTADPDELVAFWSNGTEGYVYYDSVNVSMEDSSEWDPWVGWLGNWGPDQVISDGQTSYNTTAFVASYNDYNGSVYLLYTRNDTLTTVRFVELYKEEEPPTPVTIFFPWWWVLIGLSAFFALMYFVDKNS